MKIVLRHHYKSTGTANIKKTDHAGKDVKKLERSHSADRNVK